MIPESREVRSAKWVLRLLASSIFVVIVAAVFLVTVMAEREDDPGRAVPGAGPVTTVAAPSGIGPARGSRVDDYIASRAQELKGLGPADSTPRRAIVSLRSYKPEAEARKVAGPARVVGFLVAVPGGSPTVVTEGLAAWSEAQRRTDIEERDALAALIPTSGNDPNFQACYRKEVARLDKAIAAASPTAPVVFSVVVEGMPEQFRQIAAHADVRLVDMGPAVPAADAPADAAAAGQWRGLRPEETATAGDPVLRPLDADGC